MRLFPANKQSSAIGDALISKSPKHCSSSLSNQLVITQQVPQQPDEQAKKEKKKLYCSGRNNENGSKQGGEADKAVVAI